MLKKVLSLLLAVVMVLSIASCKSDETPADTNTMDLTQDTDVVTEEPAGSVDVSQLAADYFANMPEHKYMISQQDFVDKVIAGDEMVILDIRSAEDYEKGHVTGAINVPWSTGAISSDINKISQDKEVFIYCYTGQTAGQAVATLNIAGINARTVSLGWNFGISKVEQVAQVTDTVAYTFGDETYEVSAEVKNALDAYYSGLGTITDDRFKNYKVSEADLKAMMDNNEDYYLLSIRSAEDYDLMHIEGANRIGFDNELVNNLGDVPKDKKVVVYCYTGQTAGQTTAVLRLLGYDAVSLNGGMGRPVNMPQGWYNQGMPVVSTSTLYNGTMNYFSEMPDHGYKIAQADFVDKVKAGDDMVVLDIRSADDYAISHIQGAISMPFGTAFATNLSKVPQDKEVFIYCYSGQTAGQAVMTLNLAGINARSVNLGWNFGISKVEGYEAVTTADVTEFGTEEYALDAEIQGAVEAYYTGLADVAESKFKLYKISEEDLMAMMDAKEEFFLVSARKADDYAAGHIQGAVNVPFGNGFMDSTAGVIPKNKKVVVYCYTGQTAGQAVAALRLLGYDAVSLNGGTGMASNAPMGWVNKGYALVTN